MRLRRLFRLSVLNFDFNLSHGVVQQQLSAARVRSLPTLDCIHLIWTAQLWEVMLLNSSELFIRQCAKVEFMNTLEDVLTSPYSSPAVCKRLHEVLSLAAHTSSGLPYESSFRVLLRILQPTGMPDEVGPYLLYARPFKC